MFTQTEKTVVKTGTEYQGKALQIVTRFISGLNYAKNKIAKERFTPIFTENVVLDSNSIIQLSTLSKTFFKIVSMSANGSIVSWERKDWSIYCPNNSTGDTVTIEYGYIPSDLVNLNDVLDFPDGVIDPEILCYFAAYRHHLIEGSDKDNNKASYYLSLWNDGFESIRSTLGKPKRVKCVYDMG